MSVTTRTNLATNPTAGTGLTNYTRVSGTGGNSTSEHVTTSAGADGLFHFSRMQWSAATTAVAGGQRYTQTGLEASTEYTHSLWVRTSKAQTVALTAQYQTSGAVNTGTAASSGAVALVANTWTRLSVTTTSTSTTDRVLLDVAATTGGSLWAVSDRMDVDCVLIEAAASMGTYFDGAYTGGLGRFYAWTGTAHASTSTDKLYAPVVTAVPLLDAPCARVELTITDLAPETQTVTLWRLADGKRKRVRSYSSVPVVGSDVTTDYEAPLNRTITYELEVLTGNGVGGPEGTSGQTSVITADGCGYIQDPLNPESAIKVYAEAGPSGEPTLLPDAISKLSYAMDSTLVPIMGADEPVALLGQRMARSNIPFDMFTDAAQQATDLRNLFLTASILLIRPGADWGDSLPGMCYVAPPSLDELPIGVTYGAAYCEWKFTASLVAAPEISIVVPFWSYGDWQALFATYQDAQNTYAGDTYLEVRRNPSGA